MTEFDDLVIDTDITNLTINTLLAAQKQHMLVLEAHDVPNGYAHTFAIGKYRFYAQVHYVFGYNKKKPINELLQHTKLTDEVHFHHLNPNNFNHIIVADSRYRIPNNLKKFRDRLIDTFPNNTTPLHRYFEVIMTIGHELDKMPKTISLRDLATTPFRFSHLLKYRTWTLGRLYESLDIPPQLQTILTKQSNNYLLPPNKMSLLLHVALIRTYDRDTYYPKKHYVHFIENLTSYLRSKPCYELRLETKIESILTNNKHITDIRTTHDETLQTTHYISNIDPHHTTTLLNTQK